MQRVYFLIYIAYLLLVIFLIFFDRKRPTLRFSWILLLVLVPVVGLFLYPFLGSDGLVGYRRAAIRRKREDILNSIEGMVESSEDAGDESTSQRFHSRYGGSSVSKDNQVEIFTTGATKFARLFEDLSAAIDHIHVQYFTIQNDSIGKQLLSILAEKARQGVEVKLLYDTLGCLSARPKRLFREVKAAGVQVLRIRPLILDINYRNHRKIAVIDGKIGYTGGMNVGAEYQDGVLGMPWRDTHLRITGGAVQQLQQVFLSDWVTSSKGADIGLRHELSHYFPKPTPCEGLSAQVVANGLYAKNDGDVINLSYLNMISRAARRVWIQTPYFVPSETILQTFKALASLGVDVRIMTSSTYAAGGPFHRGISNYFLRYLTASGVKVYRYDGVLHAKTLLIDDEQLCIGTVNLNTRSLERDDELYVYFESQELASQYADEYQADLQHCTQFDHARYQSQHLGSRIMESLMSLFSPLS